MEQVRFQTAWQLIGPFVRAYGEISSGTVVRMFDAGTNTSRIRALTVSYLTKDRTEDRRQRPREGHRLYWPFQPSALSTGAAIGGGTDVRKWRA
jgi:hypothetical protein